MKIKVNIDKVSTVTIETEDCIINFTMNHTLEEWKAYLHKIQRGETFTITLTSDHIMNIYVMADKVFFDTSLLMGGISCKVTRDEFTFVIRRLIHLLNDKAE